jgi:hypothetical protein
MNAAAGSLSAIDTSIITDPAVVDKMREDEDRGIPSRQGMVELKEREADAAEAAAAKLREAAAAEERRIAVDKERVAAEERRLAAEKAQLDAEAAAARTPAERAAVDEKQAELERREAELAERKEALDESSAALAENKAAAADAAEFAERKAVEAQQERESIAADQRDLIGVAQAKAAETGVLAVRLTGQSTPRGTIVKVNPGSGATLQTSPLNQVAGRTLTFIGGKTLAVAASGGKSRLVEVDPSTLQTIKEGADELNGDTQIWVSGSDLYAIVQSGGKNYLARFDVNLVKQAQSAAVVHPWAAPAFQGDKIITQNERGAIIFLNQSNLTE